MTDWLLQALLGSTVLGVVVLLIRPWVLRRLGPRMAYGLWLLPVVRLGLPPVPAWSVHSSAVAAFGEEATGVAAQIVRPDALVQMLVALWAAGALVHLVRGLFDYVRFMQRAGAAVVGPEETLDGVAVRTSAFVTGPVAAGIWKRRIFLPLNFRQRFDPDQRVLALAHERAHHRRHDIAWNFVALVALSIHWFNPWAHHTYRLYRLDQELACDRDVLAASPVSPEAYGRLIASASRTGGVSPVCALSKADLIKQRLVALTRPAGLSPRWAAASLAPAVILALAATAPISISGADGVAAIVSVAARPKPAPSPAASPAPEPDSAPSVARRPPSRHRASPAPVPTPATQRLTARAAAAEPTPSVDEDRTSPDYLARRRAIGLARSRWRMEHPAEAARARDRPIPASLSLAP